MDVFFSRSVDVALELHGVSCVIRAPQDQASFLSVADFSMHSRLWIKKMVFITAQFAAVKEYVSYACLFLWMHV